MVKFVTDRRTWNALPRWKRLNPVEMGVLERMRRELQETENCLTFQKKPQRSREQLTKWVGIAVGLHHSIVINGMNAKPTPEQAKILAEEFIANASIRKKFGLLAKKRLKR